jgi:hypothetical protein
MKTTCLLCCLFFASLTWGQAAAGAATLSSEPVPVQVPSHPQHASAAPMSQEHSLVASTYSSATGERPLWELAPPSHPTPLGDTARTLRKQHETAKKAVFVREN